MFWLGGWVEMPALGSFWLKAGVLETFDKSDLSLWSWTLMDLVIHTGSEVESSDCYYLEVIFAVLVVAITLVWRRGCLSDNSSCVDQVVLPSGAVISIRHGSY